jgi:hypothetical protein
MHQASSTMTSTVIGTMNQSVYCSNQRTSSMIVVAAGCRPSCHGVGCAADAAAAARSGERAATPARNFFITLVISPSEISSANFPE